MDSSQHHALPERMRMVDFLLIRGRFFLHQFLFLFAIFATRTACNATIEMQCYTEFPLDYAANITFQLKHNLAGVFYTLLELY